MLLVAKGDVLSQAPPPSRLRIGPHADDPRADPERPIASIVGAHCRISTQRHVSPRASGSDQVLQVCEPGQHSRLMVFADQDRLGRDPLLFTAPILHTSFAFRPEHSINPTITHWPPPDIFITGTRSGNSPPRQRHGNSIAQPNDPSRHHDEESWRARELSRLTNHVLYMAAPLPWLRHPHARGTASATTRMKRAAQTPGSLRVYSSPGRSWVAVLR